MQRHKCSVLIPLVFLIIVDVLAFAHITDDIVVLVVSTEVEGYIFVFCLTLTYYYMFKQKENIRYYLRKLKGWFK